MDGTERKGLVSFEWYLGILVVLLSVFTAMAAYQVALADAKAGELDVNAIKTLTESNTEFLRANQDVMLDYEAFDNFVIQQDEDVEAADYFRDTFSLPLEESMGRADGPFDDQYFDDIFLDADMLYEEALDLFDEAQAAGSVADSLQQVLLVLAVGLSLAGFASIGDRNSKLARLFVGIATVALVYGVLRLGLIVLA